MKSLNATCYYPDGTQEPIYAPCAPVDSTDASSAAACCALNDSACTTNGYCVGGANVFYRGGCTDPTWRHPSCPQLCANEYKDTFGNFVPCIAGQITDQRWACQGWGNTFSDLCNTTRNGGPFTFDPGQIYQPQLKYPNAPGAFFNVTSTSTSSSSVQTVTVRTTTAAAQSCSNVAAIGTGVVLGVVLLLTTLLLSWVVINMRKKNARLHHELERSRLSSAQEKLTRSPQGYKDPRGASVQQISEMSNETMAEMAAR